MTYQIKTYNRSNASLISTSQPIESIVEAHQTFAQTGRGEGYWAELVEIHPNYTITLHTTV